MSRIFFLLPAFLVACAGDDTSAEGSAEAEASELSQASGHELGTWGSDPFQPSEDGSGPASGSQCEASGEGPASCGGEAEDDEASPEDEPEQGGFDDFEARAAICPELTPALEQTPGGAVLVNSCLAFAELGPRDYVMYQAEAGPEIEGQRSVRLLVMDEEIVDASASDNVPLDPAAYLTMLETYAWLGEVASDPRIHLELHHEDGADPFMGILQEVRLYGAAPEHVPFLTLSFQVQALQ